MYGRLRSVGSLFMEWGARVYRCPFEGGEPLRARAADLDGIFEQLCETIVDREMILNLGLFSTLHPDFSTFQVVTNPVMGDYLDKVEQCFCIVIPPFSAWSLGTAAGSLPSRTFELVWSRPIGGRRLAKIDARTDVKRESIGWTPRSLVEVLRRDREERDRVLVVART